MGARTIAIYPPPVQGEPDNLGVLSPEERVNVRQALQMYTLNGAYAGFEETVKGSLETGKLADFIVVDRNVPKIPSSELKDVRVLYTFVGGEEVYASSQ